MNTTLAEEFEQHRSRLRAIAYRMLGSHSDAEDAVQEVWLRLQRSDAESVDNLGGWLTVVLSRVCLDQIRSRGSRREDPVDTLAMQDRPEDSDGESPEDVTVRADAIGAALLVVLDTLTPAERLAFVLHDLFGLPFEEIAPIVDRSVAATRQLASRARRRVQGVRPSDERERQREVVGAFLKAAREGDFGGLLQLLDPEVELRADPYLVAEIAPFADRGAPLLAEHVQGADAVARVFAGRAAAAQVGYLGGVPVGVWAPGGQVRTVYALRIAWQDGTPRITAIEVLAAPDRLTGLTVAL